MSAAVRGVFVSYFIVERIILFKEDRMDMVTFLREDSEKD